MSARSDHFLSFPHHTLAGLGMPRREGRSPEIPSLSRFHISRCCNMIADLPCVVSSRFPGHSQLKPFRPDSQCYQAAIWRCDAHMGQGDSHRKEAIR